MNPGKAGSCENRGYLLVLGRQNSAPIRACNDAHLFSTAAQNIHAATGVEYRDMLFFDDEKHNIKTVRRLGVTCVKITKESGLTFAAVNAGLKEYREACLSRSSLRGWFTPAAPKEDSENAGQAREPPLPESKSEHDI